MKLFHFFYLPFCLGIISTAHAKVFTSTGIGDTPELAKKDAISNAIKLGVGEMIVSKEELDNEQFTQKIVSYSDAYVKKIALKSQVKLPGGVYESQVEVDIESQKLTNQLEKMSVSIAKNPIDNNAMLDVLNYFDKQDANDRTVNEALEMAKTLLIDSISDDYSLASIEILSKLKPLYDEKKTQSDTFPFELTFSITPNVNYINNIQKTITELKVLNKIDDLDHKRGYEYVFRESLSHGNFQERLRVKLDSKYYHMFKDDLARKLATHGLNVFLIDLINKEGEIISSFASSDRGYRLREIRVKGSPYQVQNFDAVPDVSEHILTFATKPTVITVKLDLTKEEITNLNEIKIHLATIKND